MPKDIGEPKTIIQIKDTFLRNGWREERIPYSKVHLSEVKSGQVVTCMDPRRDERTDPDLLGPAAVGGALGLAYFLKGMSYASKKSYGERVELVVDKLGREGFSAGAHGDYVHGDIKGCKFSNALSVGQLPDEHIQEEELRRLILDNGIHHHLFSGTGDPRGLLLNHKEGTTVVPKRAKYVVDTWILDAIGIRPEAYQEVLMLIGRMLLPPDRRTLIIPY